MASYRITVRLDEHTMAQLRRIASINDTGRVDTRETNTGISRVIRDALAHHVVRHEKLLKALFSEVLRRAA